MWYAQTEAEADFICDLLADRQNKEIVNAYAAWLEARGETARAEFLQLMSLGASNSSRLKTLREQLDARWLRTITPRWIRKRDVVRVVRGYFDGLEGTVVGVDPVEGRADLSFNMFDRPNQPLWVAFADLQLIEYASGETDGEGSLG